MINRIVRVEFILDFAKYLNDFGELSFFQGCDAKHIKYLITRHRIKATLKLIQDNNIKKAASKKRLLRRLNKNIKDKRKDDHFKNLKNF